MESMTKLKKMNPWQGLCQGGSTCKGRVPQPPRSLAPSGLRTQQPPGMHSLLIPMGTNRVFTIFGSSEVAHTTLTHACPNSELNPQPNGHLCDSWDHFINPPLLWNNFHTLCKVEKNESLAGAVSGDNLLVSTIAKPPSLPWLCTFLDDIFTLSYI